MCVRAPQFWPEPGVLAVQVGVHLHVVREVLEHLCLQLQLPVLDDDDSLETSHLVTGHMWGCTVHSPVPACLYSNNGNTQPVSYQ